MNSMNYTPAGLDSATGAVAATALALHNQFHQPLAHAGLEGRLPLLRMARRLPRGWRTALTARIASGPTHPRRLAAELTSDELAQWAVSQYDSFPPEGRFPAVVIGPASGASAHLCACLGVPLLASGFPVAFPARGNPDDVADYQKRSEALLTPLLSRNPHLHGVSQFDPIHAWPQMRRSVRAHLKLADLPNAYRQFIRQRLAPDGALLLLDCQEEWGQYEIGPRHSLQVGGFGGLEDRAYTRGGPEIDAWRQQMGSGQQGGWQLPRRWSQQPEAAWGSRPELARAVQAFASEVSAPLHTVAVSAIEELSRLGFYAWQWLFYLLGISPSAALIESGPQMNPALPRRSPVLPLWLPDVSRRSQELLAGILPDFPAQIPILFQPWPPAQPAPDTVSADEWNGTLSGRRGRWLGGAPQQFPGDFSVVARLTPAVAEWSRRHPHELRRCLRWEELQTLRRLLAAGAPTAAEATPGAPPAEEAPEAEAAEKPEPQNAEPETDEPSTEAEENGV